MDTLRRRVAPVAGAAIIAVGLVTAPPHVGGITMQSHQIQLSAIEFGSEHFELSPPSTATAAARPQASSNTVTLGSSIGHFFDKLPQPIKSVVIAGIFYPVFLTGLAGVVVAWIVHSIRGAIQHLVNPTPAASAKKAGSSTEQAKAGRPARLTGTLKRAGSTAAAIVVSSGARPVAAQMHRPNTRATSASARKSKSDNGVGSGNGESK